MLLEEIKSPADIKNFSREQIQQLEEELRSEIVNTVSKNGGHLASNLGVVELTIALHRVFDSPKDAIIWDVSHQCYAHKLLTGRYSRFSTLRKKDGISGFTNTAESEHDFFINGHSSTSISSALGLLTAKKLNNDEGKVIAVIGDGALTGGMAYEGLENAGLLGKNLIVVVNDNQMSIDHNTGAVSRYLSTLSVTTRYQRFSSRLDNLIHNLYSTNPSYSRHLAKLIYRLKRMLKGLFLTNNLFTDFGFEYVGPFDGHNEENLEKVFLRIKNLKRPVVVHVVTKKGKGYGPAEKNPELFHGVGPFQPGETDGSSEKNAAADKTEKITFTKAFSNAILEAAENNPKITAITAAMAQGTGLSAFGEKYPDRFFDVGIAEEHAVTFAGGLASGGLKPVVCIYSTFVQRAVDQMIHDIALQNFPVVFCLDRAGAVPEDGATHQGIFDICLFKPIPNISIMSPATAKDLKLSLNWALEQKQSVVIRYPKLICPDETKEFNAPVEKGKGILIKSSSSAQKKILIVSTGGMFTEVKQATEKLKNELCADILSLRFIKPLDEKWFTGLCKEYSGVLFVEDGIKNGGISEYLKEKLYEALYTKTNILAFEERFYQHGTREEILKDAGLDAASICKACRELANA